MKSVTAGEMRKIDAEAIKKYGVPSIILMENAGRAVAEAVKSRVKSSKKRVAIICGKGNNGGDGLVCARHLINNGYRVSVYLLGARKTLKTDPALNMNILLKMHQKIIEIKNQKKFNIVKNKIKTSLIVDAIYGTGFKGKPNALASSVIDFINSSKVSVIAIDVPSGLDATTGKTHNCIKADKTVALGLLKKGLLKNAGPKVCGKIDVVDIGLPRIKK